MMAKKRMNIIEVDLVMVYKATWMYSKLHWDRPMSREATRAITATRVIKLLHPEVRNEAIIIIAHFNFKALPNVILSNPVYQV